MDLLTTVMSVVGALSDTGYTLTVAQNQQPVFKRSALRSDVLRICGLQVGDRQYRLGRAGQERQIGISLFVAALGCAGTETERFHAAQEVVRDAMLAYRRNPVPGTPFKLVAPGQSGSRDDYQIINTINDPKLEVEAGVLGNRLNLLFRAFQPK